MNTYPPVRKAVIPVAGMGTRFLPATKAIPKELLPVVDKPVVQYIVEEMVASGIEEIIFIISDDKRPIEEHFTTNHNLEAFLEKKEKREALQTVREISALANFVFVSQNEPLGLGHAVLQAKDAIGNEPFMVCGGDDIIEGDIPAAQQMIDVYNTYGGSVFGVMEVPKESVSRYGIIDPEEDLGNGVMKAKGVVEKPAPKDAPSNFGAGGRWLLTPEIFAELENTSPGAGGEIQLTDAIMSLMKTQAVYAKAYEGIYRDCGNKVEYIKTVISYALKHEEMGDEIAEYIHTLQK